MNQLFNPLYHITPEIVIQQKRSFETKSIKDLSELKNGKIN